MTFAPSVLVYERFSGSGPPYAVPVAALLIFCALAVFTLLRLLPLLKQDE